MHAPVEPVLRFDGFELDTRSGELRKHGRRIRLPEQSFQVLSLLLAHPGEVVLRGDLRQRLWPTATAGDFDSGLNNAVKKLRDALGDSADAPRLIETVPRRGYRFLAKVEGPAPDPVLQPMPQAVASVEHVPQPLVEHRIATGSYRRVPVWPGIAILLLILVAGAAFYQRGADHIGSIVVLPFDNLLGDASQDYFVDSVSAALTAHLSEVDGLDVISRTSAQQFKDTDKRVPEIASTLDVDWVVEGEVTRSGEKVQITVKLILASTDRSVWSQTYPGSVGDMIALQQRIARDIAAKTGRPQAGVRRPQRPINPQAYDAYLKGLIARGAQNIDGFHQSVAYLQKAIDIQPDFAEAYAELAMVQLQFVFTGPYPPGELIPKAEAAVDKALSLDDTLAQAHFVRGRILSVYHWRWDDAEKEFRRANELQGGRGALNSASSARLGRFDEALAEAERAHRLDPLSAQAQLMFGNALRDAGEHDRALEELRRALAMRELPRIRFSIGQTFVAMGRLADAIPELEATASGHNPRYEAYLGYVYAAAGRTQDARKMLAELEAHGRDQYVSGYGVALIHDALQEPELALAALQRAHGERALEFAQMRQYPPFKSIASDPRFKAIMQSVGLPQ